MVNPLAQLSGGRRTLALGAVLLVVLAAILIGIGLGSQHHAPRPDAREATPLPTSVSTSGSPTTSRAPTSISATATPTQFSPRAKSGGAPTQTSADPSDTKARNGGAQTPSFRGPHHLAGAGERPIELSIPSIDVDSSLLELGLNADRSIQTPPLSDVRAAGWYKYSPVPGVIGPSVLLGHIDSAAAGEGVFFRLGAMHRGDNIFVLRADGHVADFTVDRIVEYPKASFPTTTVYGNTDNPQIRLITCGGKFDRHTHHYLDNIVVYGSLQSLKHV